MAKRATRKATKSTKAGAGPLGFETKLWASADALRNNMDAAEYKHVVLGLIFLKYIYELALTGRAGFMLANGSMSSNRSGEGQVRLSRGGPRDGH